MRPRASNISLGIELLLQQQDNPRHKLARELTEKGWTMEEIANKLGITRQAVSQWKEKDLKNGIIWPERIKKMEPKELARNLWESGYRPFNITSRLKISRDQLNIWAKEDQDNNDPWLFQEEKFPWWGSKVWDNPEKEYLILEIHKSLLQNLNHPEIAIQLDIPLREIRRVIDGSAFRNLKPFKGLIIPPSRKEHKVADEELRALARQLYLEGVTWKEISKKVNRTVVTIGNWRTDDIANGISWGEKKRDKGKKLSLENIVIAKQLYQQGVPDNDICQELNITASTLYRWKRKAASNGDIWTRVNTNS